MGLPDRFRHNSLRFPHSGVAGCHSVSAHAPLLLLAAFYNAVARGLAVQARDGATREKLAEIGRLAMRAWPAGKAPKPAETGR